ncbi:aldehyde ferredoxin oxidoreductase, partial [candidate division KSB1 bacterium]
MPRIIRVNMQTLEVKQQPLDKSYLRLGGRGLTSWIVSQEVPPTCHPLSEKNKLIIAPG